MICVYSVLDVYQTKLLFDLGACEGNPLLRWLIDITGTWKVIVVVKGVFLLMLGIAITAIQVVIHMNMDNER